MNKEEYKELLLQRISEEILFFNFIKIMNSDDVSVRDIINIIHPNIHYKRLWYILEKWSNRGIYNYGVALDMGWLEVDDLPNK